MAHGQIIIDRILPAPSNANVGKPFSPVACKSTAPVAKISTGSCMGRAISGTKTLAFFRVRVKLLAIAESINSKGEPTTIDNANIRHSFEEIPNNGIAKKDNTATMPALKSQCIVSLISTHVVRDALAMTSWASVPFSKSGRNNSSMPMMSDSKVAIQTAELARRISVAGSLPIAKGNNVIINKKSTSGYSHCMAPCRLSCHSRISMVFIERIPLSQVAWSCLVVVGDWWLGLLRPNWQNPPYIFLIYPPLQHQEQSKVRLGAKVACGLVLG